MNNLVKLICFALFPLLSTSCEIVNSIDYDIPQQPVKIVVTGFIGLNNKAEVHLGLTHHPLSLEEDTIVTAYVSLYKGDTFIENLTCNDESVYYSSDTLFPSEGEEYFVAVSSEEFQSVNSDLTEIPEAVTIDSVKYIENTEHELIIRIYFTDMPSDNYYAFKIIRSRNDTLADNDLNFRLIDPSTVFDDLLFNSRATSIERNVNLIYGINNNKLVFYNKIIIVLYSLSEECFSFFKDLYESDYTSGDMFMSPNRIYTNITNGYGVFAGYSADTLIINIL